MKTKTNKEIQLTNVDYFCDIINSNTRCQKVFENLVEELDIVGYGKDTNNRLAVPYTDGFYALFDIVSDNDNVIVLEFTGTAG